MFFFQPANITSQIVNFGLPAPIDLQVVGRDAEANYKIAERTRRTRSRTFPAPPTFMFTRWWLSPKFDLNVDRIKASQLGLTQRDVTSSMLISLSGNGKCRAQFLVELVERRQLQRRRADAAIPDRFTRRAAPHPYLRRLRRRKRPLIHKLGPLAGTMLLWPQLPTALPRRMEIRERLPATTQLLSNLVSVNAPTRPSSSIITMFGLFSIFMRM